METSSLYRTLTMLALATAITTPSHAANLVPYRGTVAGQINGDLAGALTSRIRHQGLHVGRGTQETTSINLLAVASLLAGDPKPIPGTAITFAANGDQVHLNFTLIPAGATPSGRLLYTGTYEVTGGTGRFDYAAAGVSGHLGSGALNGEAVLVPTGPSSLTITFSHTFDGTLARPVGK